MIYGINRMIVDSVMVTIIFSIAISIWFYIISIYNGFYNGSI